MPYLEFIGKDKIPDRYWDNKENMKHFINYIYGKEDYKTMDDWYKCSRKKLNEYGLNDVYFKKYGGNLCSLLNIVYDSNYFLPWKFLQVNVNFWNKQENIKIYMDWLFQKLKYETIEDWYKITSEDFNNNFGRNLLFRDSSIFEIISNSYTEYEWLPWKFDKAPQKFWSNNANQKWYMDWLFKELKYKTIEDWYNITQKDLSDNYGFGLLNKYNGSPQMIIKIVYPSYEWLFWKFNRASGTFWDDISNQNQYMNWLFKELKYEKLEDLYNLEPKSFLDNFGSGLLKKFNGSVFKLCKYLYPEYDWLPWKFNHIYNNFWNDTNNQKWYMDWLFKKLNFETIEDLYKITYSDFINNYGRTILKYHNSVQDTIKNLYPNYNWLPWKFTNSNINYYDDMSIQKQYMNWLFKELKYEKIEDWYKIDQRTFLNNFGSGILNKYNGSPQLVVKSIFPEYNWIPWKFNQVYLNFWDDISNQRQYMDWLFKELKYETMEDWYKITKNDICIRSGATLCLKYKKYINIFKNVYPEYKWDESKFSHFKGESILSKFLLENYENVIQGFRVDWCRNIKTDNYMPYDFCIPDFKIIIELDGRQHFEQVLNWETSKETRYKDKCKMIFANEYGYSIIRLIWSDVYYDRNDWKNKLKELIKLNDEPINTYLSDIYNNFDEYKLY